MSKEYIKLKLKEFLTATIGKTDKEIDALCQALSFRKVVDRTPTTYGKRNTNNDRHHWDSISLDTYSPDKPLVICLSGNGTNHPYHANGFCKIVESMLELLFKNKDTSSNPEDYIDILACVYGRDEKYMYVPKDKEVQDLYATPAMYAEDYPESIKYTYSNNNMSPDEAEHMVTSLLLPRCVDESGHRLPIDECCRRMSQVTFFSFCYGAEALNTILDSLDKHLLMHGFSKEDIERIHSSMFHLSYARKDYTRKIPTAFFYSANDYDIGAMDKLIDYMKKYNVTLKYRFTKSGEKNIGQEMYPASFTGNTDSESIEFAYWGTEPDEDEWFMQGVDHYIANMARDKDWDIVHKENDMYDPMSLMMSWALCRAVENSLANAKSDKYIPRQSMLELRDELIGIYNTHKATHTMSKG